MAFSKPALIVRSSAPISNTESEISRFGAILSRIASAFSRPTSGQRCQNQAQEAKINPQATRKRSSEKKPILLYLDRRAIGQVDAAAEIMNVSRTAYIREAINRNLRFFELYERKAHAKIQQQARQ